MFDRFFSTTLSVTITLITAAATEAAPAQIATVVGRGQVSWAEFVNLDKTWTLGGPREEHGSQMPANKVLASRGSFLTERTGFEPADQCDPVTGLANQRFRPLSHLS